MRSTTSVTAAESLLSQLAIALVGDDALLVRATVQELATYPISDLMPPEQLSSLERCLVAGIIELIADRTGQLAPAWVNDVEIPVEPYFLLRNAQRMKNLREQCLQESPLALRKRNLYAPANYLTWL